MKNEIRIILQDEKANKLKGNCFEDLVRNLLSIHHFEIRGNINFSGMEIDLVANHKHTNESLYVECKAKEKVKSDELSKFAFNVGFKEIDKGYFFRTRELESQAGVQKTDIVYHLRRIKVNHPCRVKVSHLRRVKVNHS